MEWRPRPTDTPARPPSSATHCGASEMAASSELRSMLPSSRRRGRRAVAAASFLMLLLLAAVAHGAELVELTLLTGAQEKGAVCLDGTPPGYHLQRGFGSGTHSWLIYLQGGAWCDSIESCSFRKTTKYCDGASFAGDAEAQDKDGSTLYFRGLRIWDAVVDELMEKGLASAQQALLSGCSAGGLATLLHCNDFYARFPKEVSAKCLPDAGFFLNIEDLSGERLMLSIFNEVVQLQNVREVLPKDCLAKKNRTECFFAAELVKSIDAPTLIVNSAYDSWQIQNVLVPTGSYPANSWSSCKADIRNCSPTQSQVLNGFRNKLVDDVEVVTDKKGWGLFIDSCFTHCQTPYNISWNSPASPVLGNKTVAQAVGDWYFERSQQVKEIDCEYPCNPTCSSQLPTIHWTGPRVLPVYQPSSEFI
ncbi:hypothetical protein GUJ93_ZPchr0001g30454 [Zizania palustris]|uniref:Pectin acetylesterase n=1 Tax=Zizania palustris TaxID=103762 RepID=A0A8J5RR28_ZIZPA|nr:hypothetical protein GUJ93_ZPchr0001g30454 [Zizania palustris]